MIIFVAEKNFGRVFEVYTLRKEQAEKRTSEGYYFRGAIFKNTDYQIIFEEEKLARQFVALKNLELQMERAKRIVEKAEKKFRSEKIKVREGHTLSLK